MTPEQVHHGLDKQIYQHRSEALANAFEKYPNRFKDKMPVPESPPVAAWINKPSTDNIDSNLLTGYLIFIDIFRTPWKGVNPRWVKIFICRFSNSFIAVNQVIVPGPRFAHITCFLFYLVLYL
jgi:hypothetical protein